MKGTDYNITNSKISFSIIIVLILIWIFPNLVTITIAWHICIVTISELSFQQTKQ